MRMVVLQSRAAVILGDVIIVFLQTSEDFGIECFVDLPRDNFTAGADGLYCCCLVSERIRKLINMCSVHCECIAGNSASCKTFQIIKGRGSPITSKGRRGVAGFYARHFSVSRHCDRGAYLLSVAKFKLA